MEDTIELRRKLAFAEIKPKCIAVSQLVLRANVDFQTSKELVKALEELLKGLQQISQTEGIINPGFGDYIFFPLSHVFGQPGKFTDRVVELSLLCIHILISKCWHVNIAGELAKQLMIMMTFIIGGPPDGSRPSRASDETKLAAAQCIESLFKGVISSTAAKAQFALVENAPALGHSLTVLLDVISSTRFTDLQLASISAVRNLFTGMINDDDILASFLPGTVSTLCKFLDPRNSGSHKSKPLVLGIETLSDVLRIVLMDVKTSNLPLTDGTNGSFSQLNASITSIRTQSWVTATSEQVRMGLTGVLGLRKHRMLNVKKALLKLCQAIARDCPESLESSLDVTVETLISLSAEKEESLRSQAEDTLSSLAAFSDKITAVLQKSLHGWILSLPRVLQDNDEDKKSHLLRQIAVSFKILSSLNQSSDILLDLFSRNIKDSIINVTEHNTPTIGADSVISDISPASMELIRREASNQIDYPPTIMPGKNQEETSKNTLSLLNMLGGTSIGLKLAHEHVREARVETDLSKTISMWMALNILRATKSPEEDEWLIDSTSSPQTSKLTADLYSVALSSLIDTYDVPDTLPQLTCLSLEVLAYAAGTMKSDFRVELVDALYPIVHLFGSSMSMVQNHAIITLESIAKSCGYASTKELLVENADYLVNAVSLKLNMFNVQPQAPLVLLMMIKLSGSQIIPYLDDLVVSIFAALENYHGYEALTESLFSVLKAIVEESSSATNDIQLVTDGRSNEPSEKRNRVKVKKLTTLDDVWADLDNVLRIQSKPLEVVELPEGVPYEPWGKDKSQPRDPFGDDDAENDDDEPSESAVKEVEPKLSHTYLMIESIARLSQNFLTAKSAGLRIRLLNLVSIASPLLSKHEDNFLPLINQLWPVVTDRLKDQEPYVTIAALQTITQLCIDCGDFLSSRMEEIWPVLREIAIKAKEQVDTDRKNEKQNRTSRQLVQQEAGTSNQISHLNRPTDQISKQATAPNQQQYIVQQQPTSQNQSTTSKKTLNSYAIHHQLWNTVIPLLEAMTGYTRINSNVFDDIVGMVAQQLADGEEEYAALTDALEAVDENVVWLEMVKRNEMMRALYEKVPDAVKIEAQDGMESRILEFAPVRFGTV